jgi:2,5-diketo-D-gluconate reductase B
MTITMPQLDIQGTTVPSLGFGTWMLEGEDCRTGVATALDLGYRHLDTAQAYGNEHLVGQALTASPVPRDQVFLTTKIWNDNTSPSRVRTSFHESLEKLETSYVDLLLLHWPLDEEDLRQTLAAMVDLTEEGTARHLGVSNFTPTQLRRALDLAPIFAVQVEHHPYLAQPSLHDLASEHDLLFTAYSPLARGSVLTDPVVTAIADRRGATPAQVVLRWLLDEPNTAVIPKATSTEHIEANLGALAVYLSDDDRRSIAALDRNERQVDPPWAPTWER